MSTLKGGSYTTVRKQDLVVGALFISLALAGLQLRRLPIAVLLIAIALCCWTWVVQKDFILAFAVFFALLPIWIFLKYNAYPPIHIPGTESYVSTLVKEVFLLLLFGHWAFSALSRNDVEIPLIKSLIGYIVLIVVTLPFVSTERLPLLLRQYVEMFVLIGIPLLGMGVSKDDIESLFTGYIVGGTLVSFIALYHYFVDSDFLISGFYQSDLIKGSVASPAFLGPRLQSLTGNPNFLGFVMLMTAIISLGMLHRKDNSTRQKIVLSAVFGITTFVLALTRSRDDIGLLVVAIGLFVIIFRRRLPLIVGSVFFAIGLIFNWGQINLVFVRLWKHGNPRFNTWIRVVDFYGPRLILGGQELSDFTETLFMAIDSTYLKILIHSGIFALALFIIFNFRIVIKLLSQAVRNVDYVDGTIASILIALLGGFVFWTGYFNFPITIYYWPFICLGINRIWRRG